MTKSPTKTDLEKQVKSLQRKVAKLEKQLAAEHSKAVSLPKSPFVEVPSGVDMDAEFERIAAHRTPLPQNAFPWEQPK